MARSGQGADEPAQASAAEGSSGPAPRPQAPGRGNKAALGPVVLGLVHHVLRSRFYERIAMVVIALGSLRGIGQENRASMMARLSAWNKRQMLRLEDEAERQVRAVKGARPGGKDGWLGVTRDTRCGDGDVPRGTVGSVRSGTPAVCRAGPRGGN